MIPEQQVAVFWSQFMPLMIADIFKREFKIACTLPPELICKTAATMLGYDLSHFDSQAISMHQLRMIALQLKAKALRNNAQNNAEN